jgi:glucuronokinase
MIITTEAFARAGLVGNPSDGYYGKTISIAVRNFSARVQLYETPELHILPSYRDESIFSDIRALVSDVRKHGYYGGVRLLKAAVKRFHDYCVEAGHKLHDRNFTICYSSNIPEQVGLAGSSAIITACFRALMQFYRIEIPKPIQANLILSVETRELGIPAGLQDRVIQVYEGVVYMDFNKKLLDEQGYGCYEPIDPALLPELYIAYRAELSEGTEVFHNDIRARFNRGEPEVVKAMLFWADLADQVRAHLLRGEKHLIGPLLNSNFDKRREIYQISQGNIRMVEAARSVGASAKFTGSGGAIIGTCDDDNMFQCLVKKLEPMGVKVIKPRIQPAPKANPLSRL